MINKIQINKNVSCDSEFFAENLKSDVIAVGWLLRLGVEGGLSESVTFKLKPEKLKHQSCRKDG